MSRHSNSDVKKFMKSFRQRLQRTVDLYVGACGWEEHLQKAFAQEDRLCVFVEEKLRQLIQETVDVEKGREQ